MPDIEHATVQKNEFRTQAESIANEVEYNYQMYIKSLEYPMPFYFDPPVAADNKLKFMWDNSFDFRGQELKYTFELATSYTFKNILYKKTDILIPGAEYKMLPDGQYFYRITVTNKSGKTQTAQYYYDDEKDIRHFGIDTFYIQNGKVLTENPK
ncbi:hypothetical protein SDC9_208538 [bioreactor metagenome]|uniref:Uncharacterized protein n=1 Tax=bioreactor metagenome TaxID=1076179 RepID=A0A645JBI3_9ZZZZ